LFDSYRPDILFGEVLAKPGWTHPTLNQEEIRKNGGVPPPPQPIYPTEFAIQLYNPDTQVIVKQQSAKWSSTTSWEFSIPQITFRMPSSSDLDRTQTDPGADANTPRVNFAWRKEGRLGKDMTCYMTGKSTDLTGKKAKKSKEPDIAVALFSGLKEMSIMEPNLYRVEIEDYKGLEVALLLSAAVIRDLFFGDLREQFHISDGPARKNSAPIFARKGSSPTEGAHITPPVMTPQPPPPPAYTGPSQYPPEKVPLQPASGAAINAQMQPPSYTANNNAAKRSSLPPLQTNGRSAQAQVQQRPPQSRTFAQHAQQRQQQPHRPQQQPPRPQQQQSGPRLDPRSQWEIDAETARLKAQVEAESREQARQAEASKKARRRREQEEERQTLQFLEQEKKAKEREEKERRRKQTEIDKETERLKKQFGDQSSLLRPVQQNQSRHSSPMVQGPWTQGRLPTIQQGVQQQQHHRPSPVPQQQGPYLAPGSHRPTASHSSFFSNGLPKPVAVPKAKKSFWGLRTQSDTGAEKLKKKKSSMF
jgi:hypothetical protein